MAATPSSVCDTFTYQCSEQKKKKKKKNSVLIPPMFH